MNEAGFELFNQTFTIGVEFLYALCLALFFRPFVTRRRGTVLVFLSYLASCLICDICAAPQGVLGIVLTAILTILSGVFGLSRSLAFLLAILYWNAKISSGLMMESLYFIVEKLVPFYSEPLEAVFLRAVGLIVMFLISHVAALSVMLYLLQKRLRKQHLPLHRRELCYCCLIPVAEILFGQMVSRILIEFDNGIVLQLYERHPAYLEMVPLLALLFYVGTYLTITFQQGMAALREEQAIYYAERQQTQAIRARIREVEQFYTSVRELKHEMRGHLTNIKGLARSGEYSSLENYITQMDESMSDFDLTLQTGNPITDVIVNDKRQQCLTQNVRFQSDFHYPQSGNFDAFEVGIILQNLLQNALEATAKMPEEERFITLSGTWRGRFFLIEVKNSFAGEITFGHDGLPATTKKDDSFMHSIGLQNVRREAEKYMGELELKAQNQEFSATVLLQERSNL